MILSPIVPSHTQFSVTQKVTKEYIFTERNYVMAREPEMALYRTCTVVSDTTFKKDGERTFTEAFVDAVAEAEGVAPLDLPPLYESVDFDAITQLMQRYSDHSDGELLLGLLIDKWNIFVSYDGRIRICDASEETEPEPIFEGERHSPRSQ